ncbi:AN1-type zinc finger protein 3 [Elysia marginata]|uniref:AN1-type zinc finger protein 3 n=1 Tax=Elysia marginata TaxID=1093978 RepID=A0AAV4IN93_9GAST|nr:AN1-type zinc finger protein 3 [Elysia marginata]
MEESSNGTKPRCQCGYWGSHQTLGLCSVCYRKACRNQTQGTSVNSDAGKSGFGSCHTQSQHKICQGTKMDSRHFPSRSTTDNLPSSLSTTPGERAALSSPAAAINDTTTQTSPTVTSGSTTAGTSTSSHLSNLMSPDGKGASSESDTANMSTSTAASPVTDSKPLVGSVEQQQLQQALPVISSCSDVDISSSASSDRSYDPERNTGLLSSSVSLDSCSPSLVSIASSAAPSILNYPASSSLSSVSGENLSIQSQASGPQPSTTFSEVQQVILSAEGSSSAAQPQTSNAAILSWSNVSAVKAPSISTAGATGKGTQCVMKIDKDNKTKCEADAATVNKPASADQLVQPVTDISSPAERGTKRSRDEMEATSAKSSSAPSPQKNKKRCFVCSCKLELAQRTIGKCRCGHVFCALHRLPELHDCEFNHKEDGRREAREKMIKPTRHLGPSYRREDHS